MYEDRKSSLSDKEKELRKPPPPEDLISDPTPIKTSKKVSRLAKSTKRIGRDQKKMEKSITCVFCREEIDDSDIIHLGQNGCFELELFTDKNYGKEALFHPDCFNCLTLRLTEEERMLILKADEDKSACE